MPKHFITVTHGLSGWFAVLLERTGDNCLEPVQTGLGRYSNRSSAESEARVWAETDELPLKL